MVKLDPVIELNKIVQDINKINLKKIKYNNILYSKKIKWGSNTKCLMIGSIKKED